MKDSNWVLLLIPLACVGVVLAVGGLCSFAYIPFSRASFEKSDAQSAVVFFVVAGIVVFGGYALLQALVKNSWDGWCEAENTNIDQRQTEEWANFQRQQQITEARRREQEFRNGITD